MRISDWSSDVCSSDLGTGGARHQQHGEDERALAAVEVTEMPEHDAADGPHDEADAIGRETRQDDRQDRKSVVEGKSVSVRVDLGGRRIIKKKNTKKLYKNTHNKQRNQTNKHIK